MENLLIYSMFLIFPACFLLMLRFGKQGRTGAALLVFGFLLVYVVGLAVLVSSLQVDRLSAEARAEVVRAEDTNCSRSGIGDLEVTYTFDVDGRTYEDSACERESSYDPGADYKVCYDPADPEDSNRFTQATIECGEEF